MANSNRDDFCSTTIRTACDRVAGRCSICRRQTKGPSQEGPDKVSNVGEAAHICAAAPRGKRYDPNMTPEERKGIDNCIWLCKYHAGLIDTDDVTYTVDKLKQFKKEAEARAAAGLLKADGSPETDPLLALVPLGDKGARNVFQFNSGAVGLFGRGKEMDMLREFALGDDRDRFRWFAIAAAGGAGKTRLAYELQNELLATGEWTCVLLSNRAWGRLSELGALYPGKTLFIADYVAPHIRELGEWIKELSGEGHKRNAPLRLLLLERDTRDENGQVSWYESIVACDYENNRPYGEGCPYELEQIGPEAMPRLIRDFAGFSAEKAAAEGESVTALPPGDEEKVWEKLGEIDPVLERPLFAMILTDAWLRDPDAKRWGREELLREIVSREKAVLEKRIKAFHAPGNNALTDACLHLWMAATVMGTGGHVGAEKLLSLMPEEARVITRCAEAHAQELDSIDLKGHEKLLQTAGIFENGEIVPMLPDLIGEFFVYSELKSISLSRRIWKAAMEERDSAFEFFKRLLKDFGPMIAQKNDKEKDEYRRRLFPEDPGLDGRNTARYAWLLRDLFEEPNDIALRLLPEKSLVALAGSREGETDGNARVFNDAGSVCQDIGQHGLALEFFKKAVAASERANGKNDAFTAAVYNNIANVYQDMGDYGSALKYLKKSIKINGKALEKDHPDTAASYGNIALVYRAMGDCGSALEYNKKALGVREKALGPDHPDTATTYNNIALVYQDMGDYDSALEYSKKALDVREKTLGSDHPDTATAYNNIALVYYARGDCGYALEYYNKALGVREKALGTDHPDTATTYNNIALVYQDMGDYGSALEYHKKALDVCEKALGKGHPYTATAYNNIAQVYRAMGDYGSALEYSKKALGVREKVLGTDHPSTATTYNNIALVYQDMGDCGSALKYSKKALGVYEKALGTDHPSTAAAYNNIAQVYQDMGEFDKALEYNKKALAIKEKAPGPDHPSTATTYNNIGRLYLELGKPEEALPLLNKALDVFEARLGPEHPYTVGTRRAKAYAESLLRR